MEVAVSAMEVSGATASAVMAAEQSKINWRRDFIGLQNSKIISSVFNCFYNDYNLLRVKQFSAAGMDSGETAEAADSRAIALVSKSFFT